ncbi:dolichyl-P-Man:Man(7)GlcNAc(2)-PP-dolichol alpha-1,6-mannosyltransferase, partial [Aspergillus hancockii]
TYLTTPSLTFIAIYSIIPHKEWRFIVYAIPPLTAAAALPASYIWTHRSKSPLYRLLSIALILSTLASSLLSSLILLPASSANYPGAHALQSLHAHSHAHGPQKVHLGNLACQTGITRFLENPSGWTYDKTENETLKAMPAFWSQFDYLLIEPGEEESRVRSVSAPGYWVDVDVVEGFAGVRV